MNSTLKLTLLLATAGALALFSPTLTAGPLISYATAGSFSSGTPDLLSYAPTTYTGELNSDGSLLLTDLGTFALTTPTDQETLQGQSFTLSFMFALSIGVYEELYFPGLIYGTVNDISNSALQVHFNPDASQEVAYSTPDGSGIISVALDNIRGLRTDDAVTLTGSISTAFTSTAELTPSPAVSSPSSELAAAPLISNPEPGTLLFAGSALIALSILLRRRSAS